MTNSKALWLIHSRNNMHENRTEETIAASPAERVTNPVVTLTRRHQ